MTLGAAADTYADSMYPKQAYGNRQVLYVGNSYDQAQNLSGPARIYIQFDLSTVPEHALVLSAEILLYQMYAPASAQTYEVHIVQSPWNEYAMNWTTQPPSDAAVISSTQAPAINDVWISWNVTSVVQGWVNGDAQNYGFMIRIHDEKTGTANEASGFYSRQYPKEEVKPRLRILCQNNPPFTYLSTVHVSGLPAEMSNVISADDGTRTQVSGEGTAYFLFESGTKHVIRANEYLNATESVRYRAKIYSIVVNASDADFTITYEPQFLIVVRSEPAGLIQREWSDWYDWGSGIETPLAREVAYNESDMRILFDAWYVNGERESGNPIHFSVNGPATVSARYATTYNVTVSSPFGVPLGSGWDAAGSSAEISVTPTYVPSEGMLGYLGLGMTFDHWSGSSDSTSPKTTITVKGPIQATAVWREDRSRFITGVAVIIVLLLMLTLLSRRLRHSRSPETTRRGAAKKRN